MSEDHESMKGCFIRYLDTALKRARRDYIKKEMRLSSHEETADPECLVTDDWYDLDEAIRRELNPASDVGWDVEAIKAYLSEQIDVQLWSALVDLSDRELLIVFAKVFRGLTLAETSQILNEDCQKIADSYSYARKKMKKRWKKNGDGI